MRWLVVEAGLNGGGDLGEDLARLHTGRFDDGERDFDESASRRSCAPVDGPCRLIGPNTLLNSLAMEPPTRTLSLRFGAFSA